MTEWREQRFDPPWTPTGTQRRLATVAGIALVAALVLGRAQVVLLAAPLLGALAAAWLRPPPCALYLRWRCVPTRVLEGEPCTVEVVVQAPVGTVAGVLPLAGMPHEVLTVAGRDRAQWTVTPRRWGRWPIGPLRVRITAFTGLLAAECSLSLDELTVYPASPRLGVFPATERLVRQIGKHVAAAAGHGSEFAAVRPLLPGDSARRINWAVSSRRQELHVNEYWTERALDLVIAVDTFSDVGPAGRRTLDVAVRGASAAAAGYLRHHDRVGVVMLGGMLRWIAPESAGRQFYRIIEYVLDMPRWESVVDPDIDRIPRQALPSGALVVMFTPLLDERAVHVVRDLRERGFPLIVVDVLTCEPPADRSESSQLALRLWRLDRLALRRSLADLGVQVLPWEGTSALDLVFGPLRRGRVRGAAR